VKTAAKTPQYKVGDVVTYTTFSGQPRTITVADRSDNIKNGRPGFDGDDDNGNTYWGYDSDVTDVQSGKSKKIPKAKNEGKTENAFRTAVAELRGLIGEGRSPYARAYARHSSGDPQDDSIEPEYDTDAYEELLAEMPEFLRDALSDPDETSEVDRRGTTGTLSATVKLKDLPTLHLPQDSAFSARIYATKHGEEDADEDGYTWATSTVVGFELETEDEDDGFGEEAPSTRALLSKLRANMREFIAAVKASVPEQYHNKLK